ncbi:hypothetical protein WH96_05770 [Kiloniella spongiae]|uniref:DUF4401 domain-containing protein n=1 Tax=Kiloniella spongiae TaxID=1489064 RepID=A0A0H2MYI8_9PROT|nr:DUF4401 domain-containing protein [Kiloniella spongiae]KLN61800.1 hypothetical protein WH96_05770 [Kiloniella spongiae]
MPNPNTVRSKKQISAADLVEHLATKNLITDRDDINSFIQDQEQKPDIPIYLKILSGIGAFIAAICFIGFLMLIEIISFNNTETALITSIIFIAAAIGLYAFTAEDSSTGKNFFLQVSFALMGTGKFLFIFATVEWFGESLLAIALSSFFITTLTYPFYRLNVERFMSSSGVLIVILLNILWENDIVLPPDIAFNLFVLLQLMVAGFLLLHPRVPALFQPLSQALIVSLSISVLFLSSHNEFNYLDSPLFISPLISNILFAIALVLLIIWAAGGKEYVKHEAVIVGIIGSIFLAILSAPGILLSLSLMIFGYARHDRLFTLLGFLLLPVFLWLYYYNLDITLLQKSIVLVTSGGVMIAGKFYLKLRGWDRTDPPSPNASEAPGKGDTSCV